MITYYDFDDLHHAARTGQRSRWADFHIMRNEDTDEHQQNEMPPHICDFHQVCVDLRSDYRIGMDSAQHQTSDKSLYFLPRGSIISWSSEHTDLWAGFTIMFKAELLQDSVTGGLQQFLGAATPTLVELDGAAAAQLSALCERMLTEYHGQQPDARFVIKDWLRLFLRYANRYARFSRPSAAGDHTELKYRFQKLLSFNVERERSVAFYANALNVSPRHFTRRIRETAGRSAKQIIQEKLVEVAKSYLYDGSLTVSEVAFALNFSNVPQFSRTFKQWSGVSPSAFRRGEEKAVRLNEYEPDQFDDNDEVIDGTMKAIMEQPGKTP